MAGFKDKEIILERLRSQIASGRPIVGAGCSAGLIAKCAEMAGADLIIVYSTGRSRLMGLPTTALGDSNTETLGMFREIQNVVERTPIIGGVEAADPQHRDLRGLLAAFQERGFDGIINFPSLGERPDYARRRAHVGLGLERESELISLAREANYFTMGYAYSRDQCRLLAEAGVEVLVPHAGWTAGGMAGAGPGARSLAQSAAHVQQLIEIAWSIDTSIICLAHGGAIAEPDDTRYLYENTDAQGFVGASSIERTPVERAVMEQVRAFKSQSLRSERQGAVRVKSQADTGPKYDLN